MDNKKLLPIIAMATIGISMICMGFNQFAAKDHQSKTCSYACTIFLFLGIVFIALTGITKN